jgi:transposase-like protein
MGWMKQVGWHLEVMQVKVSGKPGYHWCAVDQDGEVLDFYFTVTRDEDAARAFLRRSLKKTGIPEVPSDSVRAEVR